MMWRLSWLLVMTFVAAGCGGSSSPQSPDPSPGGGGTISGRERLGWDQQGGAAEIGALRFAIYVDGVRNELTEISCGGTAGPNGYACSGRLPPLSPGAHTLELAAFTEAGGLLESPRSSPFRVTVAAASPSDSAPASWASGDAGATGDGVRLHIERLLDGLQFPTDAAFTTDGRIFIAERAGRIRTVRDGLLQPATALELDDIAAGGGLLAIATAPDFAQSRHVYTLSTAASSPGPVFRLARYRELRGVLAQRAVLLETPAAVPQAAMRFGTDGMLYLALGGASADAPASYDGKVLRLQPDGRAPRDRRAGMPVVSAGHQSPGAIAFRPGSPLLWIADGGPGGTQRLTGIDVAEGSPQRTAWGLPQSDATSGMTFYHGDRIPEFDGDLLIASADGQRLLRIKFGANPLNAEFSETLLDRQVGPIRVVLTGPDGAIYFCTDTALGRIAALRNP